MEFGREAVAEHLVKNNMPRFKDWKLDLSGAIDGMKDFGIKLDEIAKDIQKRKDNAIAMEFTKCIGELLKKNGVVPKMTEYTRNFEEDNTFETRYGVSIDELDFSEHDKPFEDKIAKLEEEIHRLGEERRRIRKRCASDGELHLFDVKRYDRLRIVAKDVIAENAVLKKRVSELEKLTNVIEEDADGNDWYTFEAKALVSAGKTSTLINRYKNVCKELDRMSDENKHLKQRIAELESEKSEKPVAYVLTKEIDGQHYVTVEDFMSVVNNLQ